LNDFNQIAHFDNNEDLLIPTKIQFFENKKIENVFTGFYHTFIKTLS
jgi:hypothetical protein